jgi:uncharacterized protein (TIGR03084 family)
VPAVDRVVTAVAEQHAELEDLVGGLDEPGWQTPSRCEGWSVSDVLLHLAQTDEAALASLEGRLTGGLPEWSAALVGRDVPDVDDAAGLMVERERGASGAEVFERWRTGAAVLRDAFAAGDLSRKVRWVVGEFSARTLASTRLAECWIHTGDIAGGLGVELEPTDRLWHIARLAWRTLPYAFASAGRTLAGPVVFRLRAPSGDLWTFEAEDAADAPLTTVEGDAVELCLVAGRRIPGAESDLDAEGPDAEAVLDLVRTFA